MVKDRGPLSLQEIRQLLQCLTADYADKITSDYTTKGPPETQDHSDIPAVFTTVLVAIAILVTVIFVIWMYYRKTKHCTDLKHCCSANSTYIPAVITTLLVAIAVLAIAIVPISTKNRKRSIPDVITAVLVAIAVLPVIWMCIRKRTELVLMLNRIFYPDSLVKRTIEGKQDGSNTPLPLERCRTGT